MWQGWNLDNKCFLYDMDSSDDSACNNNRCPRNAETI